MNKLITALCSSRHPMPVEDAILPHEVSPMDFKRLEVQVFFGLSRLASKHGMVRWVSSPDPDSWGADIVEPINDIAEVHCYVTGLTSAVVALIKVCRDEGISLTLLHYDRESGEYLPQKVL